MSEEKLYVVKNDEGDYWFTVSEENAKNEAKDHGGHVVTLVEEPEKVVLSKEQAKIIEDAKKYKYPASWISTQSDDEELLMNAYVNGYTVAKEKKYRVKVPETQTSYYYKGSDGHVHASDTSGGLDNEFSYSELQQYGLDGERFTKEEVTDDEQ